MNRYYCTKCNKESAVRSSEPILEFPCCDGDKTVKQRLVSLKGKEDPKVIKVQAIVEVPATPIPVTPKPVTKLDVSSGAVKGK